MYHPHVAYSPKGKQKCQLVVTIQSHVLQDADDVASNLNLILLANDDTHTHGHCTVSSQLMLWVGSVSLKKMTYSENNFSQANC